jgi:hypothetical protein
LVARQLFQTAELFGRNPRGHFLALNLRIAPGQAPQWPTSLPPDCTAAFESRDTGNKVSPGVSWLASAAFRPPSSTRDWRPSQRHTPKMSSTVSTTFVHSSAG